jgi:3-hydroxy-9,10-secoandrosta-1,3,5(10)-triene-9,17-dione monooxygenase reductase component
VKATGGAPHEHDDFHYRRVLGHYPTGVVVITAQSEDGPIGMAVNSFTSVSLEPPIISFCPALTSKTWPRLRQAGRLAVSLLSDRQADVSIAFSQRAEHRFLDLMLIAGENGAPLLSEALGWIECTVLTEHSAGDHTIVLASVDRLDVNTSARAPLVFFKGTYHAGPALDI